MVERPGETVTESRRCGLRLLRTLPGPESPRRQWQFRDGVGWGCQRRRLAEPSLAVPTTVNQVDRPSRWSGSAASGSAGRWSMTTSSAALQVCISIPVSASARRRSATSSMTSSRSVTCVGCQCLPMTAARRSACLSTALGFGRDVAWIDHGGLLRVVGLHFLTSCVACCKPRAYLIV